MMPNLKISAEVTYTHLIRVVGLKIDIFIIFIIRELYKTLSILFLSPSKKNSHINIEKIQEYEISTELLFNLTIFLIFFEQKFTYKTYILICFA